MDFIDLYKKTGFVEFFIIILEAMDFRQKLNYHNGNESDDAINEFIKLVKNYSQNQKPSLQDFVFWFETSDLLFIRENKSIDSVKISTIHGAKGLESKIVILIDSGILPANQNKIFFDDNDNIFFPGKASNISDNMNEILKNNDQDFDEYLRLLYVAISRAKQKLIICGYSNSKPHEDSWYNICYNSLLNHSDLEEKKLIIKDGIEINDEIKDIYSILMDDKWADDQYLFEFIKQNEECLNDNYWAGVDIFEIINNIKIEMASFDEELYLADQNKQMNNSRSLDKIFLKLHQNIYSLNTFNETYRKARPNLNRSIIRLYGIELSDKTIIITGGTLKLKQKMIGENFDIELKNLKRVQTYLHKQGIIDRAGLID
jgi:hypothetical protein